MWQEGIEVIWAKDWHDVTYILRGWLPTIIAFKRHQGRGREETDELGDIAHQEMKDNSGLGYNGGGGSWIYG